MKERPIIFNAPMVRAILVGRKTQTRRVVRQVPHWQHCGRDIMEWGLSDCYTDESGRHWLDIQTHVDDNSHDEIKCPFGKPGDRLWCKETWRIDGLSTKGALEIGRRHTDGLSFRADMYGDRSCDDCPWIPSIHMPRWASRITLEITGVRVERLCNITDDDAKSEGAEKGLWDSATMTLTVPTDVAGKYYATHISGFAFLWQSIYGPGSWEANPFVWVLEFKRVEEQV